MLNDSFGGIFPINHSEFNPPYINFGCSEELVESVIKAISKMDALTSDFESHGIHNGISEEERKTYYALKEVSGSLQYGLKDFIECITKSVLNEKYERVIKKEEHDCCPFCGSVVEE